MERLEVEDKVKCVTTLGELLEIQIPSDCAIKILENYGILIYTSKFPEITGIRVRFSNVQNTYGFYPKMLRKVEDLNEINN